MADNKYKEFFNKIFTGGLQNYSPRDEAAIYMRNLMNDCAIYCLKDISAGSEKSLNDEEKECAKNFMTKNFLLMNENLN